MKKTIPLSIKPTLKFTVLCLKNGKNCCAGFVLKKVRLGIKNGIQFQRPLKQI